MQKYPVSFEKRVLFINFIIKKQEQRSCVVPAMARQKGLEPPTF